jgi:hypothetical protein
MFLLQLVREFIEAGDKWQPVGGQQVVAVHAFVDWMCDQTESLLSMGDAGRRHWPAGVRARPRLKPALEPFQKPVSATVGRPDSGQLKGVTVAPDDVVMARAGIAVAAFLYKPDQRL